MGKSPHVLLVLKTRKLQDERGSNLRLGTMWRGQGTISEGVVFVTKEPGIPEIRCRGKSTKDGAKGGVERWKPVTSCAHCEWRA